jgi:hypothetical protein
MSRDGRQRNESACRDHQYDRRDRADVGDNTGQARRIAETSWGLGPLVCAQHNRQALLQVLQRLPLVPFGFGVAPGDVAVRPDE